MRALSCRADVGRLPPMTEEIRGRLEQTPFQPFVLHLADGRKLDVPHPEFVWLPQRGVLYYFHKDARYGERINPLLIVSVEGRRPRKAR